VPYPGQGTREKGVKLPGISQDQDVEVFLEGNEFLEELRISGNYTLDKGKAGPFATGGPHPVFNALPQRYLALHHLHPCGAKRGYHYLVTGVIGAVGTEIADL